MSITIITLFIVCILTFLWAVSLYNALIAMTGVINKNKQHIDIQLERRFEIFQSLIDAVKKYLDYERSTLKEVVALHNQAESARATGDEQSRINAENEISKIASRLNVVFEQYPELKSGQHVMQLQEEIINSENKLAYAKQTYNDSIEAFHARKKLFFESMIVDLFAHKLDKTYLYY